MINARFKPVEKWPIEPTPQDARRKSQFSAKWQQTLDLLEHELDCVDADDITIEGFFVWRDIRNDGWPKVTARPTQPGVILSFTTLAGPMMMPCDTFLYWEDNLRAIALTLEALRKIDRYGAARKGQQYTGWLGLPAASVADEAKELAKILCKAAALPETAISRVVTEQTYFDQVWREAVRRSHMDTGGAQANTATFQEVLLARDSLRAIKGW